jgi:pimeloyl-ACP methyl ester carboxylesterase
MANFVLVHGAWHGGWCWTPLKQRLCALGHQVHAPTLTGLGERAHLLSADVTADTHVTDIVNTLRCRDVRDVILVDHSYGDLIITGAADRCVDPIRALVYFDAFVPERSEQAIFQNANSECMAAFQRQIDAGAIGLDPDGASITWAEDPDLRAYILSKCTPHPKGTFAKGVTLSGQQDEVSNKHYIVAAKNLHSPFHREYERSKTNADWTHDALNTWHDGMLEAPDQMAQMLDRYANNLQDK